MRGLAVFIVSLVPGLLWLWFFARQDRRREPLSALLLAFFAGMIAVAPAALVEFPFRELIATPPNLFVRFLLAFLVIGAAEEGAKLLAVYFAVFRSREFDEVVDGIIYAVAASLGFAAVENLLYAAAFGIGTAPARAVVTTLAHASFGGVAGLYLGIAKLYPGRGLLAALPGFAAAAGLHGLYDFLIMAKLVHPAAAVALVYVTYRFVSGRIREVGGKAGAP